MKYLKHISIGCIVGVLCALFVNAQNSGPIEIRRGGTGGILTSNGFATNLNVYSSQLGSNALTVRGAAGLFALSVDSTQNTKITSATITNLFIPDDPAGVPFLINGKMTSTGVNTFTGTNTFSPAGFFQANGIANRFVLVTNCQFNGDAYTNTTAATATNSGFALCNPVCTVTVPAAISPNSAYRIWGLAYKPAATISGAVFMAYVGTQTNWAGTFCQLTASSAGYVFEHRTSAAILTLLGTYTNAVMNVQQGLTGYSSGPTLVDFSVPWTLRVGLYSTSSATNISFTTLVVEELVIPSAP